MSVSRDTTADAAAALHEETRPGADDPPLELSGVEQSSVRRAMLRAYARLQTWETRRLPYREIEGIRADRIALGVALAYLPDPKPAER